MVNAEEYNKQTLNDKNMGLKIEKGYENWEFICAC